LTETRCDLNGNTMCGRPCNCVKLRPSFELLDRFTSEAIKLWLWL